MGEEPLEQAVGALIEPILAEQGLELVELTVSPSGPQYLLRLLVDAVGGATLRQCARVNRLVSDAMEAANLIEGSYTVEVSSPGLDRPLVSRRDFERTLGERLVVVTDLGEGRVQELKGMLLAVQAEAIVLDLTSGRVTIPLTQVRLAKKALPW
jgi:ribosome maturation factor RimP